MRSKAPLVLMEQLIMVLVFAIAAALCLRMFVSSGKLSQRYADTDMAVQVAQTAAERIKHEKGVYLDRYDVAFYGQTHGQLTALPYDENWQPTVENAAYYVYITCSQPTPYLAQAHISVCTLAGEELFDMPVAWQTDPEVTGNG